MGACGCGDFYATAKFPGPDGQQYAIDFYRACEYCGTGHAVRVYRMGAEMADMFGMHDVPDLEFFPYQKGGVDAEAWFILEWVNERFASLDNDIESLDEERCEADEGVKAKDAELARLRATVEARNDALANIEKAYDESQARVRQLEGVIKEATRNLSRGFTPRKAVEPPHQVDQVLAEAGMEPGELGEDESGLFERGW